MYLSRIEKTKLLVLKLITVFFEKNSVDPDQLASDEAS